MSIQILNDSEYVGDACNVARSIKDDLEAQMACWLNEITSIILQEGADNQVHNWDEIQELITTWQDVGSDYLKIQLLYQILSSIPASDKLSEWDSVLSKFLEG